MSARDAYQPHVYIDGTLLAENVELAGLTPVADISIKWGTNDWWSNVEPSTANLLILDPRGDLLSLEKGAEILVTADPDGRTMFRGYLETSTATWAKRRTPSGQTVPLWEVEVEATDPLTALAADRSRGPIYAARNAAVNRLHWGRCSVIERYIDLQNRCAQQIVFKYPSWLKSIDDTWSPQGDYPVLPYTFEQTVSALTVLRKTARIEHPLNRPFYDPTTNHIRLLRPPTPSSTPAKNAALTVASGKLVMNRSVSSVPASEIDASMIVADAGKVRLDLKEYDLINRITLKSSYTVFRQADPDAGIYGTHYEIRELAQPVTLTGGLGDGSSVELETDFIFTTNQNIPSSVYAGVTTLMNSARGWRQPPRFSFDVRDRLPLPAPLAALFRAAPAYDDATDTFTAFTFVGSPLQWAGTMPSFAVVGGELRYTAKKGWQVTCQPVAVPTQIDTGTTLGDITRPEPISSFAARYLVCDLHLL